MYWKNITLYDMHSFKLWGGKKDDTWDFKQ